MNEYYFKVMVWIVIFCLYIAIACYLYFVRIPNIQTRTSREIERDLQRTLANTLPTPTNDQENVSLEDVEFEPLDEESFHHSLAELSRNISLRQRSTPRTTTM